MQEQTVWNNGEGQAAPVERGGEPARQGGASPQRNTGRAQNAGSGGEPSAEHGRAGQNAMAYPRGREQGRAQNAGPGMEPSTGHGRAGQNAAAHPRGREQGRVQNAGPDMEPSTGRYSQEELQRELDRVAKKERERGRRQALKEQQAAVHAQGEAEGAAETLSQEGQARQDSGDARLGSPQPDGTEIGGPDSGGGAQDDPADRLDAEQQRMLGHAMADKAILEGDEAVQRGIEQLLLKQGPLTPREDETLFWLFNHASLKACTEELTKRGVDGERIVKDKDFIAFAEMMRSDVPLLKVYEQYARTRGQKAKPASTGSVQGQGPAGAPYFSQDQVRHMTRKQVKKHYDEIEKSRRFWR